MEDPKPMHSAVILAVGPRAGKVCPSTCFLTFRRKKILYFN